jgi:hypothetical protein
MKSFPLLLTAAIATLASGSLALPSQAQMPAVAEPAPPNVTTTEEPEIVASAPARVSVTCESLNSVVKKGDRQAVMMKWNSSFFGREYTPEKRCSLVSERLQKAADLNGGTFKGLELASGTLNAQAVICVVGNGENRCNKGNLLFTLKPENAKNPNAVIEKMMTFAQDGSMAVEESATRPSPLDRNLGHWETKAFPTQRRTVKKVSGGF